MLVSVLIPSYNHHQYVAQAIASVLDQSWPYIDLIVIDDGSQDGSREIIHDLHERRGGFRFIARENRGLIKTLNQGLMLAEGEYFCELASDDFFPIDSIEKRVQFLQRNPQTIAVFADGVGLHGDRITGKRILDDRYRKMFSGKDLIPEFIDGKRPVFSTGMMKREALVRCGGFDDENFRFYEDLDTPIRLALEGPLGFLDEPVIFRRIHETNVSTSTSHVRREKVLFYLKLLRIPALQSYRNLIRKKLRQAVLAFGRSLSQEKQVSPEDRSLLREYGWRFVWRDPRMLRFLLPLRDK